MKDARRVHSAAQRVTAPAAGWPPDLGVTHEQLQETGQPPLSEEGRKHLGMNRLGSRGHLAYK